MIIVRCLYSPKLISLEFEDNHSIIEAYAEVAVGTVAYSTGLSEPKHTDVTQDRAHPGNGGEELPTGLAVEVQDMPRVLGDTKTSPEAGLPELYMSI